MGVLNKNSNVAGELLNHIRPNFGETLMVHFRKTLTLMVFIVFCSASIGACQTKPTLVPQATPGISVGITSKSCPSIVVEVGQQVTWTNQDSREHIVRDRPIKGDSLFDSGLLLPGDSFSFDFLQPGNFTYECSTDGVETGMITVQP